MCDITQTLSKTRKCGKQIVIQAKFGFVRYLTILFGYWFTFNSCIRVEEARVHPAWAEYATNEIWKDFAKIQHLDKLS